MFYLRLAWRNLKASYQAFFPFFLSSTTLFVLLNTMNILWQTPDVLAKRTTPTILKFAFWVIAIFTVIVIQYSYRFLLKQRLKEFGLYSVLGMNRKKIARIAGLELLLAFLFVMVFGSLFSIVLSRFLYLILVQLTELSNFEVLIQPSSFLMTVAFFVVIFVFLVVFLWLKIQHVTSLELLRSHRKAEVEPKRNGLAGIIGLLLIVVSYGFALYDQVKFNAQYITYSFIAVLAVIIGTYLFYIRFFSWWLTKQKQNRAYFYQSKHFITISNMLARMKQNAFGLANITVLATMVMTTVIATASIYLGTNELANILYPKDKNTYILFPSVRDRVAAEVLSNQLLEDIDRKATDFDKVLYLSIAGEIPDAKLLSLDEMLRTDSYSSNGVLISLSDYQALGNTTLNLAENEIGYFHSREDQVEAVQLTNGEKLSVKKVKEKPFLPTQIAATGIDLLVLIFPTDQQLLDYVENLNGGKTASQGYYQNMGENEGFLQYTLLGKLEEKQVEKLKSLQDQSFKEGPGFFIDNRQEYMDNNLEFTGPFLFIGVIIGFAFLMGACLIMYYKQISEGQEDKKSYRVLQEIGMSPKMVKKTINGQVLLIFFVPLLMAICHVSFALPILMRFLEQMGLQTNQLLVSVSSIVISTFVLLYYLVYRITSRSYYKIIER